MKRILITLLTIISISSVFAQQDKRLKGLEKELEAILEATKAPGFALAIVEGKKIIYAKGFGYRDYENKIPADANTLFAIGSTTKAFTSSILGQLRQEDKISFEESPLKYVPDFKFYNDEMNNNYNNILYKILWVYIQSKFIQRGSAYLNCMINCLLVTMPVFVF